MLDHAGRQVVLDLAAQPAQQLGHHLDVADRRARWSARCARPRAAPPPSASARCSSRRRRRPHPQRGGPDDPEAVHGRKARAPRLAAMVNLTRIYTRTGDDGTTSLGDFSRTAKTDPRLAAYADVDETNAAVGVAVTIGGLPDEVAALLRRVQNDLFDVGADLCTPLAAIVPDAAAAGPGAVGRRARGRLRPVQRAAGQAALVRPAGRYAGRGLPARGAHRRPPGRAVHLGGDRGLRHRARTAGSTR